MSNNSISMFWVCNCNRLTKIFLNLCSISDDRRTSGQGFGRVEDIKAGFAHIQVFIPTRFSRSPVEWGWSSIDTWWYHPVHVEILDIVWNYFRLAHSISSPLTMILSLSSNSLQIPLVHSIGSVYNAINRLSILSSMTTSRRRQCKVEDLRRWNPEELRWQHHSSGIWACNSVDLMIKVLAPSFNGDNTTWKQELWNTFPEI